MGGRGLRELLSVPTSDGKTLLHDIVNLPSTTLSNAAQLSGGVAEYRKAFKESQGQTTVKRHATLTARHAKTAALTEAFPPVHIIP